MHRFPFASLLFLLLSLLPATHCVAADLHDADARFEAFGASQRDTYAAVNAEYRAAQLAAPDDVALAIARCQFIGNFRYAEDISWVEDAESDLQACSEEINKKWPRAPEARVYQLENDDSGDTLAVGKKLWADAAHWPRPLRARIAVRLWAVLEDEDDPDAGRYAVLAAELGEPGQLPAAIAYLISKDESARAMRLAQSLPVSPSVWMAKQRIDALAKLKDKSVARRELDRSIAAGLDIPAAERVETYLAAGDVIAANYAAKGLAETADDKSARFNLALANKKFDQAGALVSFDDEFEVWVERYSLVVGKSPIRAFGIALLPKTAALLFILALVTVLAPSLVLIPVHYRGLMRRANGSQPAPLFDRIGLRHAWIGAAVIILLPTLAACVMRPDLIAELFSDAETLTSEFELMVAGTLASLVALSPWLPSLLRTRMTPAASSTLRKFGAVLLCWAAVMVVSWLIATFHQLTGSGDTSTEQTRSVEALVRHSWNDYGMFWTLMMMAVAVPILEEVVFRGLLLGGMARHISFGWANFLQAALFASIHFDPPRVLFYLTMGLLAGWLVRRYGRLWPAIVLHALNNALATYLVS